MYLFVFFKQKTAYEMRISDWSSDVCSSDLGLVGTQAVGQGPAGEPASSAEHEGGAGPEDEGGQDGDAGHRSNTRSSSGIWRIRPAHSHQPMTSTTATSVSSWPVADRNAWRPLPTDLPASAMPIDRTSVVSGKSVYVRVDLVGRRISKQKKKKETT